MTKPASMRAALHDTPTDQLLELTQALHDRLMSKFAAGTATQKEIAAINTARKAIAIHQNHTGRKG